MANPSLELAPGESILYQNQPISKWYRLVWKIGVILFEVALFILFSVTAFTALGSALLGTFLPAGLADGISSIFFQGIVPILSTIWWIEETVRIFTSKLILTNQRIWIKGSPFAWTSGHEIELSEIKAMYARGDTLFMRLYRTKKIQVHEFQDGSLIANAFSKFTGKTGAS